MSTKPIIITSGEPAGIGPDICLKLSLSSDMSIPFVILCDFGLLEDKVAKLNLNIKLKDYSTTQKITYCPNTVWVWHVPLHDVVIPGVLNANNSHYVLALLNQGINAVKSQEFKALVTAPIHKGIINEAGIVFKGHTEYLAKAFNLDENKVIMLLACKAMKVALVTTHLPLAKVASAIDKDKLEYIISKIHDDLQAKFMIKSPRILVTGLNPHAGESGHMGREEIDIIIPVIKKLQQQGIDVNGPFAADTIFTPQILQNADVVITMYHDQGLSVLKYASFGEAVNITLGLPIVRTSVDHGTALSLAGTGFASETSLIAAVKLAHELT